MSVLQAFILGLIQGLTEFLPVSSKGHLALGEALMGLKMEDSLSFTIALHGGTVLSTMVVFYKEILKLFKGLFAFSWNNETQYIVKLVLSMIPIVIIGLLFKDLVQLMFKGNILLVGIGLLITASLLTFTYFRKPQEKPVSFLHSILIGIAQSFAIFPGLSRSGTTISTGLLLGVKREDAAKFSFLMVLLPILGENAKDVLDGTFSHIEMLPLLVGFTTAFLSGLVACKWMIEIVKRSKLIYFGIYCFIVGVIAIIVSL